MRAKIRIDTVGHSGECQQCGQITDGPLAVVTERVPGPASYTVETYVGECCQPNLIREYNEQADRGEIEFVDARVTGPDLRPCCY